MQTFDEAEHTASGGDQVATIHRTGTSVRRGYAAEILIASFAALLLEISYTRIISYKLFYYYTFLVIGLALLGIGTGGTVVAISQRLRRVSTDAVVMWSLLVGSATVGIGYLIVALTTTNSFALWDYGTRASVSALARLLLICLAMFASFVSIGILLSTLFARRSEEIGRLYFADLIGAGAACVAVVFMIERIGPSATILLAGFLMAAAGVRVALRAHSHALVPGVLVAALLAIGVVVPSVLPDMRADVMKNNSQLPIIYTKWGPLFRVDVADYGKGQRVVLHDGLLSSVISKFNGDVATLSKYSSDDRALPFTPFAEPVKKALIIGAAGGHEILASLHFGVHHIDAVEIDPVTYSLVTDTMADYSGHLADRPDVNYVNADGRSYMARSNDHYDLIWYPAPDSYATANAATSSALVMSESYLYTTDMIKSSLEHLTSDGILADQDGEIAFNERPNRTMRYVAAARDALSQLGVHDPSSHIMVLSSTNSFVDRPLPTILVKRTPFTAAEVRHTLSQLPGIPNVRLHYAPGHAIPGTAVSDLITMPQSKVSAYLDHYPYDVSPATDDQPFYYHFVRFGDVLRDFPDRIDARNFEAGVGERVLLLLLAVSIVFAALFLLLPFLTIRRTWSAFPHKAQSAFYFAALGLGFMFFEVTLIQRLVLFLGFPTYSLTVTLASILIFTGIGSLLSKRFAARPRRTLLPLAVTLTALTLFYEFALPAITDGLQSWPLALRVIVTFLVLAPLGLCLGQFMPLGIGVVAGLTEHADAYVAWGWAVNGFASVAGAALATILAMTFGFRVVMGLALVMYLLAVVALRFLAPASPDAAAHPDAPAPAAATSASPV